MNPAAEAWPVTAAIVGIGREMRSATKDRSFESMMLFSTSLILVSSMSSSLLVEIRLWVLLVVVLILSKELVGHLEQELPHLLKMEHLFLLELEPLCLLELSASWNGSLLASWSHWTS
ncbi:uncharacterized protein LOC106382126 isoform X2 [Brassica napus]|uniref:uncharacterized protein LOC106382126 isoform X2 n=1 Tax=Brassica napus TaxID=3708 RepID=UPI00207A216E|nr:uncharacterized protein LOC106382126 isoform X2 [Brassica napus]